jgi:hypothetical protein
MWSAGIIWGNDYLQFRLCFHTARCSVLCAQRPREIKHTASAFHPGKRKIPGNRPLKLSNYLGGKGNKISIGVSCLYAKIKLERTLAG